MSDAPEMSLEEISSLLRFYAESGLDFPVGDEAVNRFETVEAPSVSVAAPRNQAAQTAQTAQASLRTGGIGETDPHAPKTVEMDPRKRQVVAPRLVAQADKTMVLPTDEVIAQAIAMADDAQDLEELKAAVETFDGCNLKRSARSTIFEGGARGAAVMIIGGAPSRDDDVSGTAFSGADGLLLEKMFQAIGLSRHDDLYASFCVPWSPAGGSAPTPLQLEMCAPFLAKQIKLAAPKIVVLLGNIAARHVFQSKQTITQVRGKWTTLPNFGVDAIAMCDPAMLRSEPRMKRNAWMDLLAIKAKLNAPNSDIVKTTH